ncbi:MAG: 30S ribosomal protein S5 [Patescibacteria group bacterium]|nr:30S ribosomal protein S5 [Patescibacteria group bacterium]MDE2116684.1 30S ribosomal protein S5 [Patescibacteria group bacterium]
MNPEPAENKVTNTAEVAPTAAPKADRGPREGHASDRPARGGRGGRGPRRGDSRAPRTKPEFDSIMLNIRRVARVVSGGRRFAFSVALVAGDRKGKVGVGLGKAGDTALAIDKATRHAKKHMIKVNATKAMSIPHEVFAKYSSARVVIRPVKDRGLVAGSAARTVLELAGLTNVSAKIVSPSKNKLNIARATIDALGKLGLERPAKS